MKSPAAALGGSLLLLGCAHAVLAAEVTGFSRPSARIGSILFIDGTGLANLQWVNASTIDSDGIAGTASVGPQTLPTDTRVSIRVAQWQITGPLTLHFSDGGEMTTPSLGVRTRGDYTGDNRADALWRHTSGGIGYWDLFNGEPDGGGYLGDVPVGMTFAGDGDFNGDGRTDLLWRDSAGGYGIWLVNGPAIIAGGPLPALPAGISFAGIGDINADGRDDIVLRDASGGVGAWLMNGIAVSSGGFIGSAPAGFTLSGIGDFNRDGNSDILFVDSDGAVGIWLLNEFAVTSGAYLGMAPAGMSLLATEDFDGNGIFDLFFRTPDQTQAQIWRVQSDFTKSVHSYGPEAAAARSFGDFNGDGGLDLVRFGTCCVPKVEWSSLLGPSSGSGEIAPIPPDYTLLR